MCGLHCNQQPTSNGAPPPPHAPNTSAQCMYTCSDCILSLLVARRSHKRPDRSMRTLHIAIAHANAVHHCLLCQLAVCAPYMTTGPIMPHTTSDPSPNGTPIACQLVPPHFQQQPGAAPQHPLPPTSTSLHDPALQWHTPMRWLGDRRMERCQPVKAASHKDKIETGWLLVLPLAFQTSQVADIQFQVLPHTPDRHERPCDPCTCPQQQAVTQNLACKGVTSPTLWA